MKYDELIEVLDENGVPQALAPRSHVHARGLWHRTIHVWVIAPDASGGRILFQQRSTNKDVAPGLFDVSVGGHLAPREEAMAGALRELEEELGIAASADALRFLGVRQTAHRYGEIVDQEIQSIFCLVRSELPEACRPDLEEVAALACLPIPAGLRFFSGCSDGVAGTIMITGTEMLSRWEPRTFVRDDFVPSLDRYFYRACIAARHVLQDEKDISL